VVGRNVHVWLKKLLLDSKLEHILKECGSCSFACPAKRQLAQSIKTMKKQVLAAKRKK
jgi:Na+-translocating ferredoxin:NAD+ oxidoreductase RnfC subunit